MNSVTVTREIDAPPEAVRAAIDDVGPFMRSPGFDRVTVDGDRMTIENAVGLVSIELDLNIVESPDEDVVFAYEQRDGIFDEMTTTFRLDPTDGGTRVTGRTEFAMKGGPVGSILDATVIKRQRRKEVEAQMDYLEATA